MWNIPTILEPFDNYVETYYMQSDAFNGFKYLVALDRKNVWSCSCPDWSYRQPYGGCKHMRRLMRWRLENPDKLPLPVITTPVSLPRFAALEA